MKRMLVLLLGLALITPVDAPATTDSPPAHFTKKKCKKKGKRKKCKKKRGAPVQAPAPVIVPPPPTPLALTEAEVEGQVLTRASQECTIDPNCYDYGAWYIGPALDCASRATYTWACYGWNDEDYEPDGTFDETCDFREIVSRSGYNGITSYQDLGFGSTGWNCVNWPGPGH